MNYYRVRAFPNQVDMFDDFLKIGYIAIGWPLTGDVSNISKEDISKKLSKYYPELNNRALGLTTGFFKRLKNMARNDIIVIPYANEIVVIAKVTKTYKFYPEHLATHTAHRVGIKVLKKLPVSDLSADLKRSIDTITTLITLDKYASEIDKIVSGEAIKVEKFKGITFLSNNTEKNIILQVSENVTSEDLHDFIEKLSL